MSASVQSSVPPGRGAKRGAGGRAHRGGASRTRPSTSDSQPAAPGSSKGVTGMTRGRGRARRGASTSNGRTAKASTPPTTTSAPAQNTSAGTKRAISSVFADAGLRPGNPGKASERRTERSVSRKAIPNGDYNARFEQLKIDRARERTEAIRAGHMTDPSQRTSLHHAITPVGTCTDMCPEFERVERIVQKMVDKSEKSLDPKTGLLQNAETKMIKRFRRSAAGYDEQLPSDIRTPSTLLQTINYLLRHVIAPDEYNLGSIHKFVWDRTRSIRNDLSIQQLTRVEDVKVAVKCLERIARFHILSLHILSSPDNTEQFDHHQEREQLNNTLLSLLYYYDDNRGRISFPNEDEFRAYYIVFSISDQRPDLESRVQRWPKELRDSPRVQVALELFAAAGNTWDYQGTLDSRRQNPVAQGNYVRFFEMIQSDSTSYLLACIAEIYFNQVRQTAIRSIWKAYCRQPLSQQGKNHEWTVPELMTVLYFDDDDQTIQFCEDQGLSFATDADDNMYLNWGQRSLDSAEFQTSAEQIFSNHCVEAKRCGRTLVSIILGMSVSQAINHNMIDQSLLETDEEAPEEDGLFVSEDEGPAKAKPPTSQGPQTSGFAFSPAASPFTPGASAPAFGQPSAAPSAAQQPSSNTSPGFGLPSSAPQASATFPNPFGAAASPFGAPSQPSAPQQTEQSATFPSFPFSGFQQTKGTAKKPDVSSPQPSNFGFGQPSAQPTAQPTPFSQQPTQESNATTSSIFKPSPLTSGAAPSLFNFTQASTPASLFGQPSAAPALPNAEQEEQRKREEEQARAAEEQEKAERAKQEAAAKEAAARQAALKEAAQRQAREAAEKRKKEQAAAAAAAAEEEARQRELQRQEAEKEERRKLAEEHARRERERLEYERQLRARLEEERREKERLERERQEAELRERKLREEEEFKATQRYLEKKKEAERNAAQEKRERLQAIEREIEEDIRRQREAISKEPTKDNTATLARATSEPTEAPLTMQELGVDDSSTNQAMTSLPRRPAKAEKEKPLIDEDELLISAARLAAHKLADGRQWLSGYTNSISRSVSAAPSSSFRSSFGTYDPLRSFSAGANTSVINGYDVALAPENTGLGRSLSRTEQRIRLTGAHGLASLPVPTPQKPNDQTVRSRKRMRLYQGTP